MNPNRKEGIRMKRSIFCLIGLTFLLQLPNVSLAECTNIGGFTNFSLTGNNTVILYSGSFLVARFDVADCTVEPTSKIQLIKSDVCDGDEIMIDGLRCTMMEIKPLGP